MWYKFPSQGNGSHKTNAKNVLRGVQRPYEKGILIGSAATFRGL